MPRHGGSSSRGGGSRGRDSARGSSKKRPQSSTRPTSTPFRGPTVRESTALHALVRGLPGIADLELAVRQFDDYLDELRSWNARGNLVAQGDLGRLVERHVAESLEVLPILDRLGATDLIDLGSGGGFPAVPLKLARPELNVVAVESRRLKALFLRRVGVRLGLERYWVWTLRAEILAGLPGGPGDPSLISVASSTPVDEPPAIRPAVDLVTARAVAPLASLTQWAAPLLKSGGRLLTFKGSRLDQELAEWRRDPGPWELEETRPGGLGVQIVLLRRG